MWTLPEQNVANETKVNHCICIVHEAKVVFSLFSSELPFNSFSCNRTMVGLCVWGFFLLTIFHFLYDVRAMAKMPSFQLYLFLCCRSINWYYSKYQNGPCRNIRAGDRHAGSAVLAAQEVSSLYSSGSACEAAALQSHHCQREPYQIKGYT